MGKAKGEIILEWLGNLASSIRVGLHCGGSSWAVDSSKDEAGGLGSPTRRWGSSSVGCQRGASEGEVEGACRRPPGKRSETEGITGSGWMDAGRS